LIQLKIKNLELKIMRGVCQAESFVPQDKSVGAHAKYNRTVCHPEERRITREARQRVDTKHNRAVCHFEERDPSDSEQAKQISTRSSTKIGSTLRSYLRRFLFLEMTKNTLKKIEIKNITTKLCEHCVFKRNQFLALFAVK